MGTDARNNRNFADCELPLHVTLHALDPKHPCNIAAQLIKEAAAKNGGRIPDEARRAIFSDTYARASERRSGQ